MIGQECGLGLRKTGKRLTFRKNIADEFMVFFQSAFLSGGHRITVKDKGMASVAVLTFKDGRIFKRGSIIGQDHGKKPGILCGSQRSIQEVKDLFDRCPGIRLHEKKEHKRTAAEKSVRRTGALLPPDPSTTSTSTMEQSGQAAVYCSKSE